jgi:hypothetical protein
LIPRPAKCSIYFVPAKKNALPVSYLQSVISIFRDPAGTRTQGPNIKSVVLYQLSYEINLPNFWECKNTFRPASLQKFLFGELLLKDKNAFLQKDLVNWSTGQLINK